VKVSKRRSATTKVSARARGVGSHAARGDAVDADDRVRQTQLTMNDL
jgi:hypothetical protein